MIDTVTYQTTKQPEYMVVTINWNIIKFCQTSAYPKYYNYNNYYSYFVYGS